MPPNELFFFSKIFIFIFFYQNTQKNGVCWFSKKLQLPKISGPHRRLAKNKWPSHKISAPPPLIFPTGRFHEFIMSLIFFTFLVPPRYPQILQLMKLPYRYNLLGSVNRLPLISSLCGCNIVWCYIWLSSLYITMINTSESVNVIMSNPM